MRHSITLGAGTLGAGLLALSVLSAGAAAQTSAPGDSPAARVQPPAAGDGDDATELAKKLQNPIENLYSIPFQNNTNFNYGPRKGTQDTLTIEPVIPIHVNQDWSVITRTVLPLVWQPSVAPAHTVPFGTGATTVSAFLVPANPDHGLLWGVGPAVQVPTISDKTLGSNVWGGGPSGVLVYMNGPWVAGALINNIWSFGGTPGRFGTSYNTFLLEPFVNYNLGKGWFLNSIPIITANWQAAGDKAWTLPVGGGVGRVVQLFGKLPVSLQLGAYYNALRPEYGATWAFRTEATIIF